MTFLYNQRGHQVLRVVALNLENKGTTLPPTVETQVLIEESSATFVDYSQKTYLNFLEDRGEILWMSERDGWNHLYLFNAETGQLKRQVTQGEWMVRRIERVDTDAGIVWFWAMGRDEEQDPYYQQLCRLSLDAPGIASITPANGTHSVQWSPGNDYVIDSWSRVDSPPTHELRNATDGSLICNVGRGGSPRVERSRVPIPGAFLWPKDAMEKPTSTVSSIFRRTSIPPVRIRWWRTFTPALTVPLFRSRSDARYRHQQEIADRGFIVVQIDGMGTNWRGKQFHDVAWKNIRDAGYPDRIAWMKTAAATRPWMDITRVGVYGGSAGGQNAMRAVLEHADFYDAAAADCGCHDNRMDKIWWNEAWMGVPGDGSYIKSSNVEDAHKLGGALLLTVGELDRNVDPSSTYQVVDALKEAGKQFEFMLMTGQGHGSAESDYGRKLRADFFVKHLLQNSN